MKNLRVEKLAIPIDMLQNMTVTINSNQPIRHRLLKLVKLHDEIEDLAEMVEINSCNADIPEVLGAMSTTLKALSGVAMEVAGGVDHVRANIQEKTSQCLPGRCQPPCG